MIKEINRMMEFSLNPDTEKRQITQKTQSMLKVCKITKFKGFNFTNQPHIQQKHNKQSQQFKTRQRIIINHPLKFSKKTHSAKFRRPHLITPKSLNYLHIPQSQQLPQPRLPPPKQ